MAKVELGYKVKDLISGMVGIVDHIVDYAHQGTMAGVKPTSLNKDGGVMDSQLFDVTQLEVVDTTPPFKIPKAAKPKFKMGEKVRDKYTGYEGVVAGYAFYINGCARVYVRPPYEAKATHKDSNGDFIAEGALESVEPPKVKPEKTTRGGPAPMSSFR